MLNGVGWAVCRRNEQYCIFVDSVSMETHHIDEMNNIN